MHFTRLVEGICLEKYFWGGNFAAYNKNVGTYEQLRTHYDTMPEVSVKEMGRGRVEKVQRTTLYVKQRRIA